MSGLAPGHVPHYFCFFHHQHQAGWSIEGSRPETMSIQVNQIAACRHAHVLTNYLFDTINTFTSVTFDKGKKKSWETYCSLDSYSQSIIQQISIQQVYVSIQLWRSQESWWVFFLFSLHRQFGPVFVPGWVCLPAGHFQSRALVFRCWLWKWIPTSSYFLWSPVFVFCVNSEVNFIYSVDLYTGCSIAHLEILAVPLRSVIVVCWFQPPTHWRLTCPPTLHHCHTLESQPALWQPPSPSSPTGSQHSVAILHLLTRQY